MSLRVFLKRSWWHFNSHHKEEWLSLDPIFSFERISSELLHGSRKQPEIYIEVKLEGRPLASAGHQKLASVREQGNPVIYHNCIVSLPAQLNPGPGDTGARLSPAWYNDAKSLIPILYAQHRTSKPHLWKPMQSAKSFYQNEKHNKSDASSILLFSSSAHTCFSNAKLGKH